MASGGTVAALAGGALLGTVVVAKMAVSGRILGISGAVKGAIVGGDAASWRVAFLGGLAGAGALAAAIAPGAFQTLPPSFTVARAAVGGLLVGMGSGLGNGCTSGHGICGIARKSVRSIAYTLTFMFAGAVVATLSGSPAALGAPPLPATSTPFSAMPAAALLPPAALITILGLPAVLLATRSLSNSVSDLAAELWAGVSFGLGLAVSGMVQPAKVGAFLAPLAPSWDPSLMFVMAAALLVTAPGYSLVLPKPGGPASQPLLRERFLLPTQTALDRKLLVGGLLFGAGWGLSGMCPGPAIVALVAAPAAQVVAYLGAMAAGMWAQQYLPL